MHSIAARFGIFVWHCKHIIAASPNALAYLKDASPHDDPAGALLAATEELEPDLIDAWHKALASCCPAVESDYHHSPHRVTWQRAVDKESSSPRSLIQLAVRPKPHL